MPETAPDAGVDAETSGTDAGPPPITRSDKVDLLLALDNAPNTDVAQDLLASTLGYLTARLAHPACVNGLGNVVANPNGPTDPCPVGQRDFAPLRDVHIGVISTSLGGHGADACSPASPSFDSTQNDGAHLLTRAPGAGVVPTYDNAGFLDWDPTQADAPPGDSDLAELTTKLTDLVGGVGTSGCPYESQLESIYRFLVDPNPYASISVSNGNAVPTGTDTTLLAQRSAFLRPDSAVVVVLITDKNDCSTRESGTSFLSNEIRLPDGTSYHLPRGRTECGNNPDDPCCASCAAATPAGCMPTATNASCLLPPMDDTEDPPSLRCFDQKRRFGVDFLYPIDRYVGAFTKASIADRDGTVSANPLFVGGRSPKLVFVAGIVGVPWQDIATDPSALATGYLPNAAIDWSMVVGDPMAHTPPSDPLMLESIGPRMGSNPAIGAPLAPPDAPLPNANPINGHERTIAHADDLQYACIYPVPAPKNCASVASDCECTGDAIATNPICQQPDGTYASIQRAARALPSIRELRVLEGIGDQGVVASVCAGIVGDPGHPAYAYKPAIDAVLRELRKRLVGGPEHE